MKKEMLVIVASLALAGSMNASVYNTGKLNSQREIAVSIVGLTQIAREAEPGDNRRGRGKDDKKGHKLSQEIAREAEPGDNRRGRGKDDKKGHKLAPEIV